MDLQTLYPDLYDVLSSFTLENVVIEINGEDHTADFGSLASFSAYHEGDIHVHAMV